MKHVCGQCSKVYASEELYLKHHCPQQKLAEGSKLTENEILRAVIAARQTKKPNV